MNNIQSFIASTPLNSIYILVEWPFVQDLMGYDWFRGECLLHQSFDDQTYLDSAYFVPIERILEVGMP